MISLQIKDVKAFMAKLLTQTTFDFFNTTEVTITTYNTFIIDGRTNKDFYSTEERELSPELLSDFSTWNRLRPICFELIKGKRTPLSFKIILLLSRKEANSLCDSTEELIDENLKSCVLTIKYDGLLLSAITGTSYTAFSMDKTSDQIWDKKVIQYFSSENIDFENLL